MSEERGTVEWPTLALLTGCYLAWALATTVLAALWLPLGIAVLILSVVLHSSLQHEVLHGHPFRKKALNEALVFLPIGLFYPYGRFRDLHLEHHRDERLTDPYDDPESNYLDPVVWAGLPHWRQRLLRANNTLLGRMLIGPALSVHALYTGDARAILDGDRAIARDWALHLAGLILFGLWIAAAEMPVLAYFASAYAGMSILKIRTFLEHRAHDLARGRSVIVEGRGVFSFLFLNNNLHTVHHAKPGVAWYKLPALYAERREEFLRRNEGYLYRSYGEIFRQYFLKAKDPVPHPLRPGN
ncbi:fatty acid desaturase [Defluviimonas sp. WL0050]|uniref:Fatty acid desaturase n=1 Tax=Albidovulum litorale TaxID=2984134 RepID=A0ABT2ZJU1_9RHOB|nr:fatty acid desaturase [Defluviimonas sp. WL0050]MCV2871399.1 fatty acid desaturase [Defluviimonas sp. WL0050]